MEEKESILSRWKAETPMFWQKIRNWAGSLSGSALAIIVANSTNSLTLPPIIITICSYIVAIGAALTVSSQLTKK